MVSDGGGPADDALLFLVIVTINHLRLLRVLLTRVILSTLITVLLLTPQGHQTQSPLDVSPQEPGEALHPSPEPVLGVRQSAKQLHAPSLEIEILVTSSSDCGTESSYPQEGSRTVIIGVGVSCH